MACLPQATRALPPGKAWLPADTLRSTRQTFTFPQRLEVDGNGVPFMINLMPGDVEAFRWAGDSWMPTWQLGARSNFQWPVLTRTGEHHMIWMNFENADGDAFRSLLMTGVAPDQLGATDTVALVFEAALFHAGAVSARRRWAAVEDRIHQPPYSGDLRLLYSDTTGVWHEPEVPGNSGDGVALAALDDTTVLMVWADAGIFPLRWGLLRGAQWTQGAGIPIVEQNAVVPSLRPRPSGGVWLGTATFQNHVAISTYRDGAWSPPESLRCAFNLPDNYYSNAMPNMSQDAGEYPAVAWSADNARTGEATVCVCVPTDAGFGVADNITNSESLAPVVTRDRNGDVWVAWWRYFDGAFWTHTYTKATASAPTIVGGAALRSISWTLSEPAPETWWAVLRSRSLGPFEEVARVRAGPALEMKWTDASPWGGVLRYKIRRECVDTRYLWESAVVQWPPNRFGYNIPLPETFRMRVARQGPDAIELEFEAAAQGTVTLELFDLQGRRVHRSTIEASGSGRDTFELRPGSLAQPLPPGIYFARATDSLSRNSNAAKILILR
jgi:hypothetical protein